MLTPAERADAIKAIQGKRILIVGDLCVDVYRYGNVERLSPEAPVPILNLTEDKVVIGMAGNVAQNIVSLGGKATVASVVGNDHYGELLKQMLKTAGITPFLLFDPTRITTAKNRFICGQYQLLRADAESTQPIPPDYTKQLCDSLWAIHKDIDAIIVQDHSKGVIDTAMMSHLQMLCELADIPLLVDPSAKRKPCFYMGATVLMPNKREATEMFDCGDTGLPSRTFLDFLAIKNVVIKMGHEGMYWVNRFEHAMVPTVDRPVFDVCGAGDTAIAALGLAMAAGQPILTGCQMGNHAAGIVVQKPGTATASVEEFLA